MKSAVITSSPFRAALARSIEEKKNKEEEKLRKRQVRARRKLLSNLDGEERPSAANGRAKKKPSRSGKNRSTEPTEPARKRQKLAAIRTAEGTRRVETANRENETVSS